jgi:hypothetical protein
MPNAAGGPASRLVAEQSGLERYSKDLPWPDGGRSPRAIREHLAISLINIFSLARILCTGESIKRREKKRRWQFTQLGLPESPPVALREHALQGRLESYLEEILNLLSWHKTTKACGCRALRFLYGLVDDPRDGRCILILPEHFCIPVVSTRSARPGSRRRLARFFVFGSPCRRTTH